MIARGVSKSGHSLDGPDFGEARPAWGAVPDCNTGNPPDAGTPGGTNELTRARKIVVRFSRDERGIILTWANLSVSVVS